LFLSTVAIFLVTARGTCAESVEITFDRDADRLGLQVSEAQLPLLMGRLAEATGIGFQIDASLAEDRLSLNRTPVATDEALRQLLRRYSYLLHYAHDAQGRVRVRSVVVLARQGNASTASSILEFPAASGTPLATSVTGSLSSLGTVAPAVAIKPTPAPPAADAIPPDFSGGGNSVRPALPPVEAPPSRSAPVSADPAE
jgi:hypothetical protein